ncbi:hypothetical protein [Ruminococcus sp.]|jgi:hypothetical protein|uniref:hypothetical protein n=1 Tax=Ruminococcus sp. TaxID=41978 RepID=UPI0025D2E291|nr:hypothetical protein [Ruminococcus sp.]
MNGNAEAVELAQHYHSQKSYNIYCSVSDVRVRTLIRVSELASGNVDAVELAQLEKNKQGICPARLR